MPETVLVTGGGGFLGSAVVRQLVARGDRVRSFARRRHAALDPLGVEQVQGDIADLQALEQACAGADVVHHTAAKAPPWGRPRDYHRVNVVGTTGSGRELIGELVGADTVKNEQFLELVVPAERALIDFLAAEFAQLIADGWGFTAPGAGSL